MHDPAYQRMLTLSSTEEELHETVEYLTKCLRPNIKMGETVLIGFPRERETHFASLVGKAVISCGGKPIFWEKDLRWKELLRLSFVTKATTIIARP